MKPTLPDWSLKRAEVSDIENVRRARERDTLRVSWPPTRALRAWAKQHGWPTPRFGFENAFMKYLLATDEHFRLGLTGSGISLIIPRSSYTLAEETLAQFDTFYDARADMGVLGSRPTRWGELVEALREIRRAVEAGVALVVPGRIHPIETFQAFYDWAHGRYPMLEEGYDSWIGDDRS